MSILDVLPHTYVAKRRHRSTDDWGGSIDGYTTVSSGRCWQQTASEAEINEFSKRGISVTDKVYFTTAVTFDERYQLTITNTRSSSTVVFDVVSKAVPDASAGMGVVWRVMCQARTDEGTAI